VADAIKSVICQKYERIEVAIIDDGSTDESLSVIRSFEGRDDIIWERQPNQGAPSARNRGIELTSGKYVKFLDADDRLHNESVIEEQVAHSESLSTERKAIVYGDTVVLDSEGEQIEVHSKDQRPPNKDPILHILSHSPLTASPLHKRNYLLSINGFDESLKKGQEFDLHIRLVLEGVEFIHRKSPVYCWCIREDEGRIGNKELNELGPNKILKEIKRKENMIREERQGLSENLRVRIGRMYWADGRRLIRENQPKQAKKFFEEARKLHPKKCINGNEPYNTFVKVMGPYAAERLSEKLKKWFKTK
jgi:glycosyltransferase involved in cell wall biosynthesis